MLLSLLLLVGVLADVAAGQSYVVGTGIAEITGPASGITMFGYVVFTQYSEGIHTRQYARATIIGDGTKRVVIVNVDSGMLDAYIKQQVVAGLPSNLTSFYNMDNILISSTHTHSAPGGTSEYFLYNLANFGFVKPSAQAAINGIIMSIIRAHNNVQPGNMFVKVGPVNNANINREINAYNNNPDAKNYPTTVDTDMTLLKLVNSSNTPVGLVNWFAVHCTSLNSSNQLISGDNKAYAAQMFERSMDPTNAVLNPANSKFVASFVQANEGDVSPNTNGGHCTDNGVACTGMDNPVCGGRTGAQCVASGPGVDMFDSAKIIGQNQLNTAQELFNSATEAVSGSVNYISEYIDISNQQVTDPSGNKVTTCPAVAGLAFAAGTTDGAGVLPSIVGTGSTSYLANLTATLNSLWNPLYICNAQEVCLVPNLFQCQAPKIPIIPAGLLPNSVVGPWVPHIVQTQILQIGSLIVLAVPGEFTTMAGRRLRNAVQQTILAINPGMNLHIVIAGLSNTYSSYTATYEEYQTLSYAGAMTLFGPNQLTAYINQFNSLATKMFKNQAPNPYTLPSTGIMLPSAYPPLDILPDCSGCGLSVLNILTWCGTPLVNPAATYSISSGATVSATFCAGSPSNNPMFETPFMTVEKLNGTTWTAVATDAFWETKFVWNSTSTQVTFTWQLPLAVNVAPGTYRIRHNGYNALIKLPAFGIAVPACSYQGISNTFTLTA